MFHDLQTGVEPGVIMLQEKSCLLWPGPWGLSRKVSTAMEQSESMVCLGFRKTTRITPFLSKKTENITLPTEGCILQFFFNQEFMSPLHGLPFWLLLVVMTAHLIMAVALNSYTEITILLLCGSVHANVFFCSDGCILFTTNFCGTVQLLKYISNSA